MSPYRPGIDPDRRKGPDLWVKILPWLALGGWLAMLIALVLVGYAKPETETFYDRHFGIKLRDRWDLQLTAYLFYLMIAGLLISSTGFFINMRRHRRKNDEYRISLILLGLVSLLGICLYIFGF